MRDWDVSSTEPAGGTPVRRSTPAISPGGRDAGTVLALQNCAGNAAVGRMFMSEPEPATDVREATDDVDQLVVEQDSGFGAGLAAGLGGELGAGLGAVLDAAAAGVSLVAGAVGAAAPAPTPVTITTASGNAEMWWFDTQRPGGYPVEQTLRATAAGGAAGTFTWTVTGATAAADFGGSTSATGASALLSSKAPSASVNDVVVRVSFAGAGGATGGASVRLTVRAPQSMTRLGTTTTNNAPTSYLSRISYSIKDQFGRILPRNVPINERWDNKPPIPDFAGTNWPSFPPTEGGAVVNPANWNDQVAFSTTTPTLMIPPITASGGALVQHFAGHWQVGSTTIGAGRRALSVTWQFFQDRGAHT